MEASIIIGIYGYYWVFFNTAFSLCIPLLKLSVLQAFASSKRLPHHYSVELIIEYIVMNNRMETFLTRLVIQCQQLHKGIDRN